MKYSIVVLTIVLGVIQSYGQNNQIKLYIQQIAANAVYLEYLQKGYSIVKNGLNTIGNIKDGHFSLDKDFFSQLENINPKVRHYAKVADIIALNIQIVQRYKRTLREAGDGDWFTEKELQYFEQVFDKLVDNCSTLVEELTMLMRPKECKMSDDERIRRIDQMYGDMQDNETFVKSFSADLSRLKLQRARDKNDADVLSGLYK